MSELVKQEPGTGGVMLELTERERFLMREAFEAGTYYPNLTDWLNEPITEFGYTVETTIVHDADRLHPVPDTGEAP